MNACTTTAHRARRTALLVAAFCLVPLAALAVAPRGQSAVPARRARGASPSPAVRTRQPSPAPPARVSYNRDIRPILAENCFACHGPDSAARKANLRLDRPEDATAARPAGAAVVPGKPAVSGLIRRLTGHGPVMPPAATKKSVTPQQVALLQRWVAEGARYEAHWSYQPVQRPALLAVRNASWVRNPVDRFILARLEQAGLSPAPEADRRTLARRVSLDLTGLPPDPREVEAYLADPSPSAYEKFVDRLLASPRWGEHRARYWLDAARYADTHGIHFDNYREIWSYRDWVINAFNANLPFDRFTIEQLAGDLLPNPTLEQRVATGFNRCNITTSEGGAINEEYLVLYTRDRTETVAQVWMGTTAGCAVCHDHKFDPLTQRDFYSLAAFFNNTTQPAMDGNVKDTPPIVAVPRPEDRARWDALGPELSAAKVAAEERRKSAGMAFEEWRRSPAAAALSTRLPSEGLHLRVPLDEGTGSQLRVELGAEQRRMAVPVAPGWQPGAVARSAFQRTPGSQLAIPDAGDLERDQPFSLSAWVRLASPNQGGSLVARMDDTKLHRGWDLWLEGGRPGIHLIHRWPEDALKVVARAPLPPDRWNHVAVTYSGGSRPEAITIYVNGVPVEAEAAANSLQHSIRTEVPLKIGQRHTTAGVDGAGLQEVRLYHRVLLLPEVEALGSVARAAYLAAQPAGSLADAERSELFGWWLATADEHYRALASRVAALEAEERGIRLRGTIAHVSQEKPEEPMAHVLFRGEYDQRRDAVKPATPAFLPPMPAELPRNRLGFARWLLLPDHPLTARVTVNRFWQEVFGAGLVRTTGDLGITGELPSHPELLDWLSVEFRERGWDVKQFFRLLVTSATYRQSAAATPLKRERDPQNRLLSRGPRFRMDAEMIRDYALAVSGLLSSRLGGPSVRPYQPDGVWEAVAMIGSNTRDYRRDSGEALYRRSLYTFWKRSAPPASMEIFNAPSRETCTVRRERTNTPLQALVTMNDPQFVEAARVLAQHTLQKGGATAETRLAYLTGRVVGRAPRKEEWSILRASVLDLEAFYRQHASEAAALVKVGEAPPDPALPAWQVAAWTMVANQLLNLDEVLNK